MTKEKIIQLLKEKGILQHFTKGFIENKLNNKKTNKELIQYYNFLLNYEEVFK